MGDFIVEDGLTSVGKTLRSMAVLSFSGTMGLAMVACSIHTKKPLSKGD